METAEMRRSTLQRKDRDELTEIATTLGKKPPSRARKGEIIDLILDLAAGGDGEAGASDESAAGGSDDTVENDPSASADDAATTDDDAAGGRRRSAGPSARRGSSGAESPSADSSEQPTTNDSSTEDQPDQGQGRGRDDSEPGNRRRRRRGRDRDNRESGEGWTGDPIPVAGHLDLRDEGYGFLRVDGVLPSREDAYVPVKLVRQFGLRKGDAIAGSCRPANRNEKNPALLTVDSLNGGDPADAPERADFDALVAVHPVDPLVQVTDDTVDLTPRIIDLLVPLAKGQRVLVVAPPRVARLPILKTVVASIEANDPDVHVMALLVDGRPEDVTDLTRTMTNGEVIASSVDKPAEEQTVTAEMTLARAKRMVEAGNDVCIVLDGITRLARAYDAASGSGRVAADGLDSAALHAAKRFFGAARNVEDGGSLTIIATALTETGVDADELALADLRHVANAQLRLDQVALSSGLAPAIDVIDSSTDDQGGIVPADRAPRIAALRRHLVTVAAESARPTEPLEDLLARLESTDDDDTLLAAIPGS